MTSITGPVARVRLGRSRSGIPEAHAENWEDGFFGLGFLHGRDRGAQIEVMRAVAEGRLCERLADDEHMLALDRYFRRLGFARDAERHAGALAAPERRLVEAYCAGVERARERHYPALYRLVTGPAQPFAVHDVLTLLKLTAYAGLAEGQRMVELFALHALRRGLGAAHLQELLPGAVAPDPALLDSLDELPPLYATENLGLAAGASGGSNAWAVAGNLSASGAPLLANDPHLEINRLPAVIYEAHLAVGEERVTGASLPGLPGFVSGRNRHLAWGVTYSCIDTADFFVERCRDGTVERDGRRVAVEQETQVIRRKRQPDAEFAVYRAGEHTFEQTPADGARLSWRWVGQGAGGLGSIRAFVRLLRCRSAGEARACMQGADIPTLHMVFADRAGDIAYQCTGAVPRRRGGWSGLLPAPAFDERHGWDGLLDPAGELPGVSNPASGILVIANDLRPFASHPDLCNCALAHYRGTRIEELLAPGSSLTPADFQRMHYDVQSVQARTFLPAYLPHLPDGPHKRLLQAWDTGYGTHSRAATLFERLHRSVVREVFGGALGKPWFDHVVERTGLYGTLSGYFDQVLLRPDSLWLPATARRGTLDTALGAVLRQPLSEVPPWGEHNRVRFDNLFFGGQLPAWLRMDLGPFALAGNHATVSQGSTFNVGDRRTSFAPCYRMVADLANGDLWSNYPGGGSERRLSRRYRDSLDAWFGARYRRVGE